MPDTLGFASPAEEVEHDDMLGWPPPIAEVVDRADPGAEQPARLSNAIALLSCGRRGSVARPPSPIAGVVRLASSRCKPAICANAAARGPPASHPCALCPPEYRYPG